MGIRRLILLGFAFAAMAPAAHADELPASVRVLSCSPWQEGEGGAVSYEARMRSIPGSARMALRLRVLQKVAGGEFEPVNAEGLGGWRKSRPGALSFRYEQQVKGLRKDAVYRAEVQYRWLDATGRRMRSTGRTSAPCRQAGGKPNLRVSEVSVAAGLVPETAVYTVTVVNRGDSHASGIGVLLRVDGEVVDEVEVIETLGPGESTTVDFSGPACRSKLRAVVDPKGSIAEAREDDNVRTLSCV